MHFGVRLFSAIILNTVIACKRSIFRGTSELSVSATGQQGQGAHCHGVVKQSPVSVTSVRPVRQCSTGVMQGSTTVHHRCHRLLQTEGLKDRRNDVLFCGNLDLSAESNVIFFGGDIQDYPECMKAHRDNHRYEKWNVEATAQLLLRRFPHSHVWVVKAKEMSLKTFAVYSNFVNFPDFAAPIHTDDYGSWQHLVPLLHNAVKSLKEEVKPSQQNDVNCLDITPSFAKPSILIGFSKGCVVLNQLLYELGAARADSELSPFVDNVREMYWLDGGHNGGSNTYVTHRQKLESLVGTNIHVNVHVTPYQMNDTMRAWLKKEKKKFVQITKELGVPVTDMMHFDGEERDIHMHFGVLERF